MEAAMQHVPGGTDHRAAVASSQRGLCDFYLVSLPLPFSLHARGGSRSRLSHCALLDILQGSSAGPLRVQLRHRQPAAGRQLIATAIARYSPPTAERVVIGVSRGLYELPG